MTAEEATILATAGAVIIGLIYVAQMVGSWIGQMVVYFDRGNRRE